METTCVDVGSISISTPSSLPEGASAYFRTTNLAMLSIFLKLSAHSPDENLLTLPGSSKNASVNWSGSSPTLIPPSPRTYNWQLSTMQPKDMAASVVVLRLRRTFCTAVGNRTAGTFANYLLCARSHVSPLQRQTSLLLLRAPNLSPSPRCLLLNPRLPEYYLIT